MKVNLTHAANRTLPGAAKDMAKAYVDEEFKARQKIYSRRILLATCIVLNDLFHFGDKRLMWVLKGIEDVVSDYAERVLREKGKDYRTQSPEEDEISRLMQEELLSRDKIHLEVK